MIFCYICRSVPYSVMIRQASSCRRWEKFKDLPGREAENERLLNTDCKMVCLQQITPLRSQGKRKQKESKRQKGQETPGKQALLINWAKLSEITETDAACTGPVGLCTSPLCIYSSQFSVLMGLPSVWISVFLIPAPSFVSFLLYVYLVQCVTIFILFYLFLLKRGSSKINHCSDSPKSIKSELLLSKYAS